MCMSKWIKQILKKGHRDFFFSYFFNDFSPIFPLIFSWFPPLILTCFLIFFPRFVFLIVFKFFFRGLASEDYVKLIWTTFAEFPGTILAFILIDWIGRKKTMAILSFLFAISTLGVVECQASKTGLIILLFCSRGFATGLLQSVYVYTPEAYPTNLRAVALGKIR